MNFDKLPITNMLPWWGWTILAAIPPLIVLLYFLKLRRQPIEVPSTFLWRRTIEDLHVNSLWQRLRQNLLLLLQLLLILLLILACIRPAMNASSLTGDRHILMIDNSASMSASDVDGTRLKAAQQKAKEIVNQMKSGDAAMVISFADASNIVQSYTDNRGLLLRKIDAIQPTSRTSDLTDALRYASGLANPGRSGEKGNPNDVQAAAAQPATVYILSDGGFNAVPNFSLGNLTPRYSPIGAEEPANVGIVSFTSQRNPEKPEQFQAFCRVQNFGPEEVTVDLKLYLGDEEAPRDVARVTAPPEKSAGADFDLLNYAVGEEEQTSLKLVIDHKDDLAVDNTAYAALNAPQIARVLLVTLGNPALKKALTTPQAQKLAAVTLSDPSALTTKEHQDLAGGGAFDLIIYDRCTPPVLPQASTLFIAATPPGDGWKRLPLAALPGLFDVDRVHPLMHNVEMNRVEFKVRDNSFGVKPPSGGAVLIDSDQGAVLAIAPREGYEDAVFGLELITHKDGDAYFNTNWPTQISFPLFVQNVLKYLGGSRSAMADVQIRPGALVKLRTELPAKSITITNPAGQSQKVLPEGQSLFTYSGAERLGVYTVREEGAKKLSQQFAVNLFDERESDIRPRPKLDLGHTLVTADKYVAQTRNEFWKWLLLLGVGVLLFEWYIFNKRVYL